MTIQNAILSIRQIYCTKDPFLLINNPREHFQKVFFKQIFGFKRTYHILLIFVDMAYKKMCGLMGLFFKLHFDHAESCHNYMKKICVTSRINQMTRIPENIFDIERSLFSNFNLKVNVPFNYVHICVGGRVIIIKLDKCDFGIVTSIV